MADLTAQMVFTADASGVEAGVGQAKRSLADLGVTAAKEGKKAAEGVAAIGEGSQQAAAKVDTNTRNLINSIQRATAAAEAGKKSGSEFYAALANQRGVSTEVLKPYLAQLDQALAKQKAAQEALNATAPALGRVGVSAAQTAAALRGVPAQFTDIVTSLQGGQAPLTVFLQQGGQLKDMFGGIGPAAKALGGYVLGLINPFTVAAAAAGALALAYYQGSQEAIAYNRALILTGNYAGQTAGQLQEMAKEVAGTTSTQGKAAEALAALASTGRVTGDALKQAAEAVVGVNRVLGTSVKDAVDQYIKLGDEPTKASAKLNESMHYLTQSTYERIKTLEDQGRKEEAAALAQSSYASAMKQRTGQVTENLGSIERAWKAVTLAASQGWDAILGVGRSATMQVQLAEVQRKITEAQKASSGNSVTASFYEPLLKRLNTQQAVMQAAIGFENGFAKMASERAKAEQAGADATDDVNKWQDKAKGVDAVTRELKKYRDGLEAIRKVNPSSELLTPDAIKAGEAAIRKEFAGSKGPKEKAFQDDAATKMLETLRQTEAALKDQLDGELKITDTQKKQVEFQQLIADLKGKKILTAEQQSLLANKDAIEEQLKKNVALSNQLEFEKKIAEITKKSAEDAKQFRQQMDAINVSITGGQDSRNEQSDRSLAAFGLGDRARQEVEAQRSIRAEFQRYLTSANKEAGKTGQLGSPAYQEEVVRIKKALDDALAAQSNYFDALKSKETDWQNGATTALANYTDAIRNVAATTERAFTDGFKGAEDALAQFVTTGKLSVSSLANSVIADLARIAVQQTITGPLAKGLLGALNGPGGGSALSGDAGYLNQIGLSGSSGLAITGGGMDWSKLFSSVGGWFSGLKFAEGGVPPVGKASLVGENGPEMFVPSVPGTIIPNHALNGSAGGGTTVYNLTVGDVATKSMVVEAMQTVQRQTAARYGRSRSYGGDA
ncbi:phage tail tape measure protein [Variovorax paradoxus]|uniref:phage tail tape measure protein n=1 Tax=Variovorax paradoxus TaxID=34073 RepID=UPI002160FCDC|nr:phage tail tape measure protein [Variovorax paradoxus]UVH54664.1 phage tail tape measure protein [Variovorax paradoxus]